MRFKLLQARLPNDVVREEERAAFASQMGVSLQDIVAYDMLSQELSFDTVTGDCDALLVGGSGAFSVLDNEPWIRSFIDLLGHIADQGFPTFASCFGFQGMVLALGGEVVHDEPNAEVGSFLLETTKDATGDPLFGALPTQFVAQEGHKDRAKKLPGGVTNLAQSERCPYQAIRVRNTLVYATQFHPELTYTENRKRFGRYFDMYSKAFGRSEAESMMDAFKPSPEANALLRTFTEYITADES